MHFWKLMLSGAFSGERTIWIMLWGDTSRKLRNMVK